jgi:xanthine dehydrogenase accessory factor
MRAALDALDEPDASPRLETFRLGPTLGMCCGGSVDVLIEPLEPMVQPAPPNGPAETTLPGAPQSSARLSIEPVRVVHADHDDPEMLRGLPADLGASALVVMTPDHQLDQAVIEWALGRGFGFVGGVGSRAKTARTRARLEQKGVAVADIERVRMPVGVDIGARSPAELGVAIVAELIAWRAGRRAPASSRAEDALVEESDAAGARA